MTFWGFGMNFMLRMNFNIAIVSMVQNSVKTKNDKIIELYEKHNFTNTSSPINNNPQSYVSIFIIFVNINTNIHIDVIV